MTLFYALMKRPWLLWIVSFIVFAVMLNIALPGELTPTERFLKSILCGIFGALSFMLLSYRRRGSSRYPPPGLQSQENIIRSTQAGYIIDGQPAQGELILTTQRLIFRCPDKHPTDLAQLAADRQEINDVRLSGTHSAYRTGVTVQVNGRQHIFTVPLAERWVTDIRNVVMHGHTAN